MLWTFFGRFHPATVHFPIALLSVAALLEFFQIVRRKPGLSPATFPLTLIGVATAAVATVMGWALASDTPPKDVMETHRWAGVATTVVAAGALALVVKARSSQGWIVQAARGSLFLAMVLVSLTGHWGGQMTFGPTWYSDAWTGSAPPQDKKPRLTPISKVDFVADIAPIIKESCFSCHGGGKGDKNGEGGLLLTTRMLAMKGGDEGPCIVPFKPDESSFYTLLIHKKPNLRMPKKAKQLPPEQIERVRLWIEKGAVWPDGYEFKK